MDFCSLLSQELGRLIQRWLYRCRPSMLRSDAYKRISYLNGCLTAISYQLDKDNPDHENNSKQEYLACFFFFFFFFFFFYANHGSPVNDFRQLAEY